MGSCHAQLLLQEGPGIVTAAIIEAVFCAPRLTPNSFVTKDNSDLLILTLYPFSPLVLEFQVGTTAPFP